MKQQLLKSIILITSLLTLATTQAWGVPGFKKGNIYFDITGWNDNKDEDHIYLCVGKDNNNDNYTNVYELSTRIENTQLVKGWCSNGDGNNWWDGMTYFAIVSIKNNTWTSGNWGSSNISNATHYTSTNNSVDIDDSTNPFLCTKASTNNNATLTITKKETGITALNYTQTLNYAISTNNGSSYTNLNSGTTPATINISSYKFVANNYDGVSASSPENTLNANSTTYSTTISAAHTATTTTTTISNIQDGYSFQGWYEGSTKKSEELSYTYYPTAATTLTARFIKQTTHNVNVSYQCASPSATVSTSQTIAVGESSASSITAPEVNGYTFSNWTLGDGLQIASGSSTSSNPISVTTKTSGTYTLQADYTEDLTTTWQLRGDVIGWAAADSLKFKKRTGESAGNISYVNIYIKPSSFAEKGYKMQMKMYEVQGEGGKYYGNCKNTEDYTCPVYSKSTEDTEVEFYEDTDQNPHDNYEVTISVEGIYTFKWNESTKKLSIHYPTVNQLQIYDAFATSGGTNDTEKIGNYNWDNSTDGVFTKTLTLAANQKYKFKVVYNSDFYGFKTEKNGTTSGDNNPDFPMTSTDNTDWRMYTDGGDSYITTTIAGEYIFSFNSNNSGNTTLSVQYPRNIILSCDKNSWAQSATNMVQDGSTTKYYYDITLDADNLQNFKVIYNSVWYGATNTVLTTASHDDIQMTAGENNAQLATTTNTSYRFIFDTSTKKVSVTYHDPAVPAMTGSLTISGKIQSKTEKPAIGNGTEQDPYIFFTGQQIVITAEHTSAPSADSHFRYTFYQGSTAKQTAASTDTNAKTYTHSVGNTAGDDVYQLRATAYYEYGHENYLVQGTEITSNIIYYKVVKPVARLTSTAYTAFTNETYTLTATMTTSPETSNFLDATAPYKYFEAQADQNFNFNENISFVNSTADYTHSTAGTYKYTAYVKDKNGCIWQTDTISVQVYDPANSIVVRFNTSEVVSNSGGNDWGSGMKVHYWGSGESGKDVDATAEGDDWYSAIIPLLGDDKVVNIQATASNPGGNNDMRTTDIENVTESGCYIVLKDKNQKEGDNKDKRLWKQTEDCQLYYAVQSEVGANKYYSNRVFKDESALSFYANTSGSLSLVRHKNGAGWDMIKPLTNTASQNTVFTSTFARSSLTIGTLSAYTGDYYLYSPAVTNGKNHKEEMDSLFIYFESDNSAYTADPYHYYWVDWAKGKDSQDLVATVGNRINPNLAVEIADDNLWNSTTRAALKDSVNVRYAYNPSTNYFSRALLKGATNYNEHFLMLYDPKGKTRFRNTSVAEGQDGDYVVVKEVPKNIPSEGTTDWCATFKDMNDWVYYLDVKATGESEVIAYSDFYGGGQYLFGEDATGKKKTVDLLNNAITTELTVRLIYDFKTGMFIIAWVPNENINSSVELDASMMVQRKGNGAPTCITLSGSAEVTNIKHVYTVIEITESDLNMGNMGTYFFSLPYNCKVSDVFGLDGAYLGKWALLKYNGARRAQYGLFSDSGSYWELVGRDETLQRGVGYVLQVAGLTTAQKERGVHLYFPSASSEIGTLSTHSDETTTLAAMTYTGPTHSGNGINHAMSDINWYAIGTPGYGNMTATFTGDNEVTSWYTSGTPQIASGNFYYEWSYNNGTQTYTAKPAASEQFKPTYAYIFQWAGTINWSQVAATPKESVVARKREAESSSAALLELQLLRGGSVQDRTYINLHEMATTGFDLNHDLTKMPSSGDNIYTRCYDGDYYVDLAANNLPLTTTEVPLLVSASTTGEYTFSKNAEYTGVEASIYDKTEERMTDLDFSNYTVNLTKGEYADRFVLRINKKNTTTALSNNPASTYQLTQADGQLYIGGIESEAEVALYDLLGHTLYQGKIQSGESISCPVSGMYLLRVNDQTQLTFIK